MTRKKTSDFVPGYSFTITGRHVDVTQSMKEYALDKLSKIERFGSRIIDVNIVMDIQRIHHIVEITMQYGHTLIVSKASTTDMYASIDEAVHKLNARIKKYRSRLIDHHSKGHPTSELPVVVYENSEETAIEEINSDIEREGEEHAERILRPHEIVKRETQTMTLLTDEEAIMKMEFSQAPLLVFRDERTQEVKIIYRRQDGNYGVISINTP